MDFAEKIDMMDDDCDIEGFPIEDCNIRKKEQYRLSKIETLEIFERVAKQVELAYRQLDGTNCSGIKCEECPIGFDICT